MAADPVLRDRVTVRPTALEDTELPVTLSAVVGIGVLHHFGAEGRRFLLRFLAERLGPDARAFLEVQEPPEPCLIPDTRYHTATVGDLVHEGWMRAAPGGPTAMDWTMAYRTLRGAEVVDEHEVAFTMHPASTDLVAEAIEFSLGPRRLPCGLLELRRPAGRRRPDESLPITREG